MRKNSLNLNTSKYTSNLISSYKTNVLSNENSKFSFGFPLLSIVFHYFSKLFPVYIKCQSDVNMK
jgi:hypothetical protein